MKNNEKKNNRKGLLVLLLLFVTVVTGAFGFTYSKYTSSSKGNAKAKVAKWSVLVEDTDIALNKELSLDDIEWDWENDTSTAEEGTIAPGSVGRAKINVENESQVDIVVNAEASEVKNGDTTIAQITASLEDNGTVIEKGESGEVTLVITWENVSPTNDESDTELGIAEPTLTIPVTITASQNIQE